MMMTAFGHMEESRQLAPRDDSHGGLARPPESAVAHIDARIGDQATPIQEAVVLVKIRGEILRQDEFRKDREDARRAKGRSFWGKLAFSVVAVGTGAALISTGLTLEGFVILGVGFHWLAPDFVRSVYDRVLGGKDGNDAE
jgi:hypothetical protein